MAQIQSKILSAEKINLHPRNKHRFSYDFNKLIDTCNGLNQFVFVNKYGNESIDFANPDAVKILNKALLQHFYDIQNWDIPPNYLCPPIPGRADYIHYMADLLASVNNSVIPKGRNIKALDIGMGANCVYPIIGSQEYGWSFLGSDIDKNAINSAIKIIEANSSLAGLVECRLQSSATNIFKGIMKSNELIDITLCNPPFHKSFQEAVAGTQRKIKNLGLNKSKNTVLNFGGQSSELWCNGGEVEFVKRMIMESSFFPKSCFWFSTLISKSAHLSSIYNELKKINVNDVKTIDMAQGNKVSRIVAWTFLTKIEQNEWRENRWK